MALLAALAGGLLLAGYLPMQRIGALGGFLAGCGVSLAGSLVGGVPLALTRSRPAGQATGLLLGSLLLRLGVVLLGALAVLFALPVDRRVFLLSVVVSYLIFLAADLGYALHRRPREP